MEISQTANQDEQTCSSPDASLTESDLLQACNVTKRASYKIHIGDREYFVDAVVLDNLDTTAFRATIQIEAFSSTMEVTEGLVLLSNTVYDLRNKCLREIGIQFERRFEQWLSAGQAVQSHEDLTRIFDRYKQEIFERVLANTITEEN
jgi:hypothetical protein